MGVTRFSNGIEIGDGITAGDFTIGGTAVTVTAAQINTAGGEGVDHTLAHVSSDGIKSFHHAGTVITGAGTVATGLASVVSAVPSLTGTLPGTASGNPWVVTGGTTAGGSVILRVYDATGAAASAAGTVSFHAFGT